MSAYFQRKKLTLGRDYLAEHIDQPFCLDAAAKSACLSPFHFLRAFKKTYGQTPNEFIIQRRIEQAKHLLITENMSVSAVCEQVGYSSLGSFSSLFQKAVGVPPTQYRRKFWMMSAEQYRYPVQAIPSCYVFHFLGKTAK